MISNPTKVRLNNRDLENLKDGESVFRFIGGEWIKITWVDSNE